MKELTIEQKAERYDKAIEKAKIYTSSDYPIMVVQDVVTDIFPELKESEDERIRKNFITFFKEEYGTNSNARFAGIKVKDVIAWLEKQGEQKDSVVDFKAKDWYVSKVDGKIHKIYHSVDKVEPKFKVGDWITNGDYTWKIIEVKPFYYILQSQDSDIAYGSIVDTDSDFHHWTTQDAKDGDVLISQYNDPFIYKGHCNGLIDSYGGILYENQFYVSDERSWTANENIYPATKEQRDILFQKMKDAGYDFDFEKKEMKKVV